MQGSDFDESCLHYILGAPGYRLELRRASHSMIKKL
jgi:hypothetical protein